MNIMKMKYKDFEYKIIEKNEITVTRYTGRNIDIVIPTEIKGYPVTNIGGYAFFRCSNLESIIIPDSVTNIGDGAFRGCSNLTSITIPDGITTIGYGTFRDCIRLESIDIPDSVESIDVYAFDGCRSLESITIPSSVTSIKRCAFRKCSNLKTKIANYKVFRVNEDKLVCKDYDYKENEWSEKLDEIEICEKGYHFCTNLFDMFNYYGGELDKDIAIYECEVGNKIEKDNNSEYCTNKIKPIKRLHREDIIRILNGGE